MFFLVAGPAEGDEFCAVLFAEPLVVGVMDVLGRSLAGPAQAPVALIDEAAQLSPLGGIDVGQVSLALGRARLGDHHPRETLGAAVGAASLVPTAVVEPARVAGVPLEPVAAAPLATHQPTLKRNRPAGPKPDGAVACLMGHAADARFCWLRCPIAPTVPEPIGAVNGDFPTAPAPGGLASRRRWSSSGRRSAWTETRAHRARTASGGDSA